MIIAYKYFSLESVIIIPMVCTGILGCLIILIILKNISGIHLRKIISAPFNNCNIKPEVTIGPIPRVINVPWDEAKIIAV